MNILRPGAKKFKTGSAFSGSTIDTALENRNPTLLIIRSIYQFVRLISPMLDTYISLALPTYLYMIQAKFVFCFVKKEHEIKVNKKNGIKK